MEIKTKRLVLKEIVEKDAELIVSWRKNPKVYRYFRSPHELTMDEHIKWYKEKYVLDSTQIQFIAYKNVFLVPIGVFGIRKCIGVEDCVEVSYLLDAKEHGNGFAQEALLGMMKFAQKEWNAKRVIAEIHMENQSSIKMIKKLDFKKVKEKDSFVIYERQLCFI